MNPVRQRRLMIVFQILNIFLFAILGAIVVATTAVIGHMHKDNSADAQLLELWRTDFLQTRVNLQQYVMTSDPKKLESYYVYVCL